MSDALPDIFTSLSKYHTIESHYEILAAIKSDISESVLRKGLQNPHLFGTARRYLLIRNKIVVRDRLIDFVHSEGELTRRLKMVMYFLFMFRDARYRDFVCETVAGSSGKWSRSVFESKHTSYFAEAGGHKAFTNLRQLLFRIGILNERTMAVDMGEVADWLPVALEIAAQHLPTDSRTKLIASPHGFLIRNKLNALVNCTPEEVVRYALGGTYEDATDLLPRIEGTAGSATRALTTFKPWRRGQPGKRQTHTIDFSVDPIAFERANYQHWLLEQLTAAALSSENTTISTNQLVDMLAQQKSEAILFEMKSCNPTSTRSQIRRAISQLLEYKFLHQEILPKKIHLCLVLERRPRGKTEWLLEYLDFLEIAVIWKKDTEENLICSSRAYAMMRRFGCHKNFTADK
ncbi:MAG: hypothetical protein JWM83_3051 [Candidatus Angelobacter sp.]|nr:hypothetical protein [Candidatus Angelobacter sp.]